MKKKIVLALGGNALGHTSEEQQEASARAAIAIADLICAGHDIVIAHGNGPQVGKIQKAMEEMPLDVCVAMSQGYIGYHLQLALKNELARRGVFKSVIGFITPVLVDGADLAFQHPTKPVGAFYTLEQAEEMMARGIPMTEDAGRGFRKVVPSPKPKEVVEWQTVKELMECGHVVIAAGGGGIPVVRSGDHLEGVEAVVDKDFASVVLAESIDADEVVILTAVEKVAINFRKPDEKWLDSITPDEAEEYIRQGHFAPGSMLPKMTAAAHFAQSAHGRRALITHLDKAAAGIAGKTGTIIVQR